MVYKITHHFSSNKKFTVKNYNSNKKKSQIINTLKKLTDFPHANHSGAIRLKIINRGASIYTKKPQNKATH